MPRLLLIGNNCLGEDVEDALQSKGNSLVKFKSLGDLRLKADESPDVIIVDKDQRDASSFREFVSRFRDVPRIVISRNRSFAGFGNWLRHPLTFPVCTPSPRELDYLIGRALTEKSLLEENARMKKRLDALMEEVDFFEEVSRTLTSKLDLQDMLSTIMRKAKKLIKAGSWGVFLVDEESGDLISERTIGKRSGKRNAMTRLKIGEGIAGWVAQEGIPVVVPDISKDKRFSSGARQETDARAKSLMCVPIRSKGTVLGVLEITNKTDAPFTKDDLSLLMRLVDHAAIAVERASLYRKMEELSITDDLTKLFNTRYLNRTLEIELTRANRYGSSLSLIFMDVDHFKVINDNYGHLVGSKLLVEMGQLLIRGLRTIDIVARYGGDEFVIVLPQTTPHAASQIAERIRKMIEQNVFLRKEGYSLRLTASFGVASYPERAKSKEELLRLADEAMYRVKHRTRNGVYAIL